MKKQFLNSEEFKQIEQTADLFKTLGHPYKLTIFKHFCDCGCQRLRVKHIYETLGMQQGTASRHLSAMKKHGVLKRVVEDGVVYFVPNTDNKIVHCLSQCLSEE